jgi:hypothetical protein
MAEPDTDTVPGLFGAFSMTRDLIREPPALARAESRDEMSEGPNGRGRARRRGH